MISFINVSKKYPKDLFIKNIPPALDNLSFSLESGQTIGLIGANGAGKSTTIRLLMDFIRPDDGRIKLFHSSPKNILIRKKIGYLPETTNFPPNLNILSLLKFTATSCNVPTSLFENRCRQWLNKLELWEARKRPLRTYSKGMQQRANFALALINNPDLLILDEPMSGLDPMGRTAIIQLILQLKEEGKTILFCSHILNDVDKLVDNILLLHKGKKIFCGTPKELTIQEKKDSIEDAFVSIVTREEQHE